MDPLDNQGVFSVSRTFGIDFGTTNSLVALIEGDRELALVDSGTNRPHPSVVWYRGNEVVVGRTALDQMDLNDGGAPPGFVRSPKSALRREGLLYVDGRGIMPIDIVAEVLKHLKNDAAIARDAGAHPYELDRAVMTIPVDFGGVERRALRQAARKAGIGVVQFVHEPAAALYAYLRSEEGRDKGISPTTLEGRTVLVFDWGGGTLDLTLCRIAGGSIIQIANVGLNHIGGDRFDERLRNAVREKHAQAHGLDDVSAMEQPGVGAKLLRQCELIKIRLSDPTVDRASVVIRNYLRTDGDARDLSATVTRDELDARASDIVRSGLAAIDELLERAGCSYDDIALCLATGGMTNMPAIRNGLTERFLGRVPLLPNGDRIIAEGAAWIARDSVRAVLAKPIELLIADTSESGSYHPLVPAGERLPVENETMNASNLRLFCVDPREGRAMVEIAKPIKPGRTSLSDARETIGVGYVEVDPDEKPLIERIQCTVQIDHDYVGRVVLASTAGRSSLEFHDLEFALALGHDRSPHDGEEMAGSQHSNGARRRPKALAASNVTSRTNVGLHGTQGRRLVPGDVARQAWPDYFDVQSHEPTPRQREEDAFYSECARCYRLPTQFREEGCESCHILPRGA
jgi:actin-like ATPase involved in cell morphogenesis